MHPFHPHIRKGCLKHTVMMQYNLKRGLQVFGAPGTEAVFTKMKQLHDWSICEPQKAHNLTPEQCHNALGYLMFLKEKGMGKSRDVAVWMVANSISGPQREILVIPLQLLQLNQYSLPGSLRQKRVSM